jgi:hypothetical protein
MQVCRASLHDWAVLVVFSIQKPTVDDVPWLKLIHSSVELAQLFACGVNKPSCCMFPVHTSPAAAWANAPDDSAKTLTVQAKRNTAY